MFRRSCSSARLGSVIFIGVIAGACGDGATAPARPGMRVLESGVQAAGIVSVRTTGVTLTQPRYDATLGGAALIFARMDDSTLVGIVPEVAAGSYELSATLGGEVVTQSVMVAAARSFADPAGHVAARLDEVEASYAVTAPAGVTQAAWTAQRDSMLAAVAEARSALAGMSASEQLAAARFVAAIEEALAPLLAEPGAATAMSAALAASDGCSAAAGRALLNSTLYLGGFAALVGGVMVPGYQLLVPMGAAIIWKAKPRAEQSVQHMMAECQKQKTVSLSVLSQVTGGSSFQLTAASGWGADAQGLRGITADSGASIQKGQASSVMIFARKLPVRTAPRQGLQAFSGSHIPGNAQFSAVSSALERVHQLIEATPAFVRRLLPAAFRISTVGEKPVQVTALGPDSVRIGNVTGGVSLTSRVDGAALILTADAPGADERQFRFVVTSSTEAAVRDTVDAILVKDGVTLIPRAERWTATITVNEAQNTWTMRCRMEWSVVIAGVNPVHLSSMRWDNRAVGAGFPSYPGSEQYPYNSYAPGTYNLWGEWWRTWVSGENSSDFIVDLEMGYRDNVTGSTGTTNPIEMSCVAPLG